MSFLPKDIENIILDYKNEFEEVLRISDIDNDKYNILYDFENVIIDELTPVKNLLLENTYYKIIHEIKTYFDPIIEKIHELKSYKILDFTYEDINIYYGKDNEIIYFILAIERDTLKFRNIRDELIFYEYIGMFLTKQHYNICEEISIGYKIDEEYDDKLHDLSVFISYKLYNQ